MSDSDSEEDKKMPPRKKAKRDNRQEAESACATNNRGQVAPVAAAAALPSKQKKKKAPMKAGRQSAGMKQARARAAEAEALAKKLLQHPADCHKDNECPENETPEERRLRKNRINERRKRARRKMKVAFIYEQKDHFTVENEKLRKENELLRQRIENTKRGDFSFFQRNQGSPVEPIQPPSEPAAEAKSPDQATNVAVPMPDTASQLSDLSQLFGVPSQPHFLAQERETADAATVSLRQDHALLPSLQQSQASNTSSTNLRTSVRVSSPSSINSPAAGLTISPEVLSMLLGTATLPISSTAAGPQHNLSASSLYQAPDPSLFGTPQVFPGQSYLLRDYSVPQAQQQNATMAQLSQQTSGTANWLDPTASSLLNNMNSTSATAGNNPLEHNLENARTDERVYAAVSSVLALNNQDTSGISGSALLRAIASADPASASRSIPEQISGGISFDSRFRQGMGYSANQNLDSVLSMLQQQQQQQQEEAVSSTAAGQQYLRYPSLSQAESIAGQPPLQQQHWLQQEALQLQALIQQQQQQQQGQQQSDTTAAILEYLQLAKNGGQPQNPKRDGEKR